MDAHYSQLMILINQCEPVRTNSITVRFIDHYLEPLLRTISHEYQPSLVNLNLSEPIFITKHDSRSTIHGPILKQYSTIAMIIHV